MSFPSLMITVLAMNSARYGRNKILTAERGGGQEGGGSEEEGRGGMPRRRRRKRRRRLRRMPRRRRRKRRRRPRRMPRTRRRQTRPQPRRLRTKLPRRRPADAAAKQTASSADASGAKPADDGKVASSVKLDAKESADSTTTVDSGKVQHRSYPDRLFISLPNSIYIGYVVPRSWMWYAVCMA